MQHLSRNTKKTVYRPSRFTVYVASVLQLMAYERHMIVTSGRMSPIDRLLIVEHMVADTTAFPVSRMQCPGD